MKKALILAFILSAVIMFSACGTSSDKAELAKIPQEFPTHNAPIFNIAEFVSYTDKSVADQYSAEIVYNSNSDYDSIIEYYKKIFPDGIYTDFGIAYNVLNVMPAGTGHLVSVRIYSSVNKGEKGTCTITISALEQ